jgi:hypothetical protein
MKWQWVDDAHNWHRWRSVQFGALGVLAGAMLKGYSQLGEWAPNLQHYIPGWSLHVLTLVFYISPLLALVSRAIDQPNLPPAKPKPPPANDFHQHEDPPCTS